MKTSQIIRLLFLAAITISIVACTKGSSSNEGGDTSNPPPSNGGNEVGARTNCGVVVNGKVVNPITDSDGQAVRIEQPGDSNALIVTTATGGKILVKLQGVSNEPSALRDNAISFLDRYSGYTVLFVSAGSNCSSVVSGGGSAQLGQLITSSGESISEQLIRTGFANSSSSDACGSELISSCLTALHESDPLTAGALSSFLWKPQADSDGNLAIHTGPYGTIVTVNGEVGTNQGSGNGYGSLARFNKPGCSYGGARITVRSSDGFAYTVGGQTTFTVGNPCGRHCLVDGSIVACSK